MYVNVKYSNDRNKLSFIYIASKQMDIHTASAGTQSFVRFCIIRDAEETRNRTRISRVASPHTARTQTRFTILCTSRDSCPCRKSPRNTDKIRFHRERIKLDFRNFLTNKKKEQRLDGANSLRLVYRDSKKYCI